MAEQAATESKTSKSRTIFSFRGTAEGCQVEVAKSAVGTLVAASNVSHALKQAPGLKDEAEAACAAIDALLKKATPAA